MCATETNYVHLTATIIIPESFNKSQAERLPSWKCSLLLNNRSGLEGEGSTWERVWGKGGDGESCHTYTWENPIICFEKGIADSLQILCSQHSGQCSENANPTDNSGKTAETKELLTSICGKTWLTWEALWFYPPAWKSQHLVLCSWFF